MQKNKNTAVSFATINHNSFLDSCSWTAKYFFLGITIFFSQFSAFAQQNKSSGERNRTIDSLKSVLSAESLVDTTRIKTLNALTLELKNTGDYEQAMKYANDALALCEQLLSKKEFENLKSQISNLKSKSYTNIGLIHDEKGDYVKAIEFYFKALKIFEEIGNKKGMAASYNNIGNIHSKKGDYAQALEFHFKSLKMREEIGNKKGMANSYTSIGIILWQKGDYAQALEFHFKGLKIFEEIGDKKGMTDAYNNIGNIHTENGDYALALEFYFKSLKIREEIGDKKGMAMSYGNIGVIHWYKGDYDKALEFYFKGVKINEEIGDKQGMAVSYNNIGDLYLKQNKPEEARKQSLKSLGIAEAIGSKDDIMNAYLLLAICDSTTGNFKSAYQYHKLYSSIKDSIFNEKSNKQLIEMQTKYESEKKDNEIKLLNKDKETQARISAEENRRKNVIIGSVISGLLLVVLFAGFIFRSLRFTKKQKQIIEVQKLDVEQKNVQVEKQKHIIEEKNKDITDSITYARRIQRAMLPHRRDIWAAFPNSFVLFKPKDIVSGDFYFFHYVVAENNNSASLRGTKQSHNEEIASPAARNDVVRENSELRTPDSQLFIAAADCTGHGVPGAFMSLIGAEKLKDAVSQSADTSHILNLLNRGIKTSLRQSDSIESTRDGMDIALVKCMMEEGKWKMEYAGANRPLWIIRKGQKEVEEIKATKKAIGGLTEDDQHFDTHEIKLQQGDTFYIFTDGYADTFGGQDKKKLMTKKLKEILLEIQNKTMKEQEKHLDNFVENWKAGTEQVDDILVIGVRL